MEITDTYGKVYTFGGSLCGGFTVRDVDLTQLLREYLVFDGRIEEEKKK